MRFTFGMTTVGSDGAEASTLKAVLLSPATRELTHVIVRSPRVSEDLLLPLSLVQGNADQGLLLHAAGGDLENMPRYYEGRATPPAGRVDTAVVREPGERRASLDEALNVPPDAVVLGPDTRARTVDQREGWLVGVTSEEYANRLSEVHVGGIRDHVVAVPERWIGTLRSDAVSVSTTSDQLERLIGPQGAPYIAQQGGEARQVIERERPRE